MSWFPTPVRADVKTIAPARPKEQKRPTDSFEKSPKMKKVRFPFFFNKFILTFPSQDFTHFTPAQNYSCYFAS
jgi:hypothetical protein